LPCCYNLAVFFYTNHIDNFTDRIRHLNKLSRHHSEVPVQS
jgi:hypothetical protein